MAGKKFTCNELSAIFKVWYFPRSQGTNATEYISELHTRKEGQFGSVVDVRVVDTIHRAYRKRILRLWGRCEILAFILSRLPVTGPISNLHGCHVESTMTTNKCPDLYAAWRFMPMKGGRGLPYELQHSCQLTQFCYKYNYRRSAHNWLSSAVAFAHSHTLNT